MQEEVWRFIPGFNEQYSVSNFGNVFSWITKRPMKLSVTRFGYLQVGLQCGGKQKMCAVHRLVALTFIKKPEDKPEVNHINGDKTDNCVENLEWCTRSENMKHAHKTGLITYTGQRLTDTQVAFIRKHPDIPNSELAKLLDMSISAVSAVKNYRTHKKVIDINPALQARQAAPKRGRPRKQAVAEAPAPVLKNGMMPLF